jgi:hypothetical protein
MSEAAEPRFLSLQGLMVKGTGMKAKQRYFNLELRSLTWYKNKAECDEMSNVMGKIDLSDPLTEIVIPTQKKIKKEVFCFAIVTPGKQGKTYELFPTTAEEWEKWIRAVAHNIINSQKQTAGAPKHASLAQMAGLGQCEIKSHAGFLYRKSKRKYIRLDGMILSYHTDKPPKGKLEANLAVFGCRIERLETGFRINMPPHTHPSLFDFDVESLQAREEWISIIEGNQRLLEATFVEKNSEAAGGGPAGAARSAFFLSLPAALRPFHDEMGNGEIPQAFKDEFKRLSQAVQNEAKLNATILTKTLASPVVTSVQQDDTGSLSQSREVGAGSAGSRREGWMDRGGSDGWIERGRERYCSTGGRCCGVLRPVLSFVVVLTNLSSMSRLKGRLHALLL